MARDSITRLEHSAGIDYGMGTTNIDHDTSIRYGVLPMHEITQAWCDSADTIYGPATCPDCGSDNVTEGINLWTCNTCGEVNHDEDMYGDEPNSITYTGDGYDATQDGDDTDIFITKSPYYTLCDFCSPCAPGAGYTLSSNHDGIAAYCFGHDWFDDNQAPYPVYDVATNKEVPAPTQATQA